MKVVVLLIQSCEYLLSATNDGRTSHSFHILGNPSFASSIESIGGGEFDQSDVHQDQFPPGFVSLPTPLVWLILLAQLRVIQLAAVVNTRPW